MTEYKGIPVTVECAAKSEFVEDFVKRIGLRITVHERDRECQEFTGKRYYADFGTRVSYSKDGMEGGIFGDGNTPEEAAAELLDTMRRKVRRLKIYSSNYAAVHYIECPTFL